LKLETVSRALSALNNSGVIQVHQRSIEIVDADALHAVIDPAADTVIGTAPCLRSSSVRTDAGNAKRARKASFRPGHAWQQLATA
jgi:hypothetical protein